MFLPVLEWRGMSTGAYGPRSHAGNATKLIFWEFPRGSWYYDLVVAGILAFIFLTPRDWFGDQPRAANIVLISSNRGSEQLYLEPGLLSGVPEGKRNEKAAELIRQRTGKHLNVVRVEPIRDEAEQELKGFIAYTSPRH
jgi:hypothetical protein